MIGLSRGLVKGGATRTVVKDGLQAWYKADNTLSPLGEEMIRDTNFDLGHEKAKPINTTNWRTSSTSWGNAQPISDDGVITWGEHGRQIIGDNQISTGQFETADGSDIDTFSIANDSGTDRATKTWGGGAPRYNNYLKITYTQTNGHALYIGSSQVTSNKWYNVKFRARGTTNNNFEYIGDLGGINETVYNPVIGADWQDYEFNVHYADGETDFRIYLNGDVVSGEYFEIDDIEIKQTTSGWASIQPASAHYDKTVIGKFYLVKFDANITAGTLQFKATSDTGGESVINVSSTGTVEEIVKANGTDWYFTGNKDFKGSLSNVSLKQINPLEHWHQTGGDQTAASNESLYDVETGGLKIAHATGESYGRMSYRYMDGVYGDTTYLEDGCYYEVKFTVLKNSGCNTLEVWSGSTGYKNTHAALVAGETYTYEFKYSLQTAQRFIFNNATANSYIVLSDISVRKKTNAVRDFSKNSHNAVLYSGRAVDFDGTGDYFNMTPAVPLEVTGDYTFAMWVNADEIVDNQTLLTNSKHGDHRLGLSISNSKFVFNFYDGGDYYGNGSDYYSAVSGTIEANRWYRIVGVNRGGNQMLYVDGKLVGSVKPHEDNTGSDGGYRFANSSVTGGIILLGMNPTTTDANEQDFNGQMCDVQIYDKAWSHTDVEFDYNNPEKDVFDDVDRAEVLGEIINVNGDVSVEGEITSSSHSLGFRLGTSNDDGVSIDDHAVLLEAGAHTNDSRVYLTDGSTIQIGEETCTYDIEYEVVESNFTTGFTFFGGDTKGIPSTVGKHSFRYTKDAATTSPNFVFGYLTENSNKRIKLKNIFVRKVVTHKSEILPTDCKRLFRMNEGYGQRIFDSAPLLGTELVANPNFTLGEELIAGTKSFHDGSTTGWSAIGGSTKSTLQVVNGKLNMRTTMTQNLLADIAVSGTEGKSYIFSAETSDYIDHDNDGGSFGTVYIRPNGVHQTNNVKSISSTRTSVMFTASENFTYIRLASGNSNQSVNINNVSLKEVPNWTGNVLESGWTVEDGKVNYRYVAGGLVHQYSRIKAPLVTEVGALYTMSFTLEGLTNGNVNFGLASSTGDYEDNNVSFNSNGTHTRLMYAVHTDHTIAIQNNTQNQNFTVSNVTVKKISPSKYHGEATDIDNKDNTIAWVKHQTHVPQVAMSSYSKKLLFQKSNSNRVHGALPTHFDKAKDFTVSLWYMPNGVKTTSSDRAMLFGFQKQQGDHTYKSFEIGHWEDDDNDGSGEDMLIYSGDGTSDGTEASGVNYSSANFTPSYNSNPGKLTHIVVETNSQGKFTVYENGIRKIHNVNPGWIADHDGTHGDITRWIIGSRLDNAGSSAMDGIVDEVSIFDGVLDETEVSEIYNHGTPLDVRNHSAYYGNDLLQGEGDFSNSSNVSHWTLGTAWSYDGVSMVKKSVANETANYLAYTIPSNLVSNGKAYEVSFDLNITSANTLTIGVSNSGWLFAPQSERFFTTSGRKTVGGKYLTSHNSGSTELRFVGNSGAEFGISNVIVREVKCVGYWRNNGSMTWKDLTPNRNDGTVASNAGGKQTLILRETPYFKLDSLGTVLNRPRTRGFNLDGESYATVYDSPRLSSGSVSVEFWVMMKEIPGGFRGIVSKYENLNDPKPWLVGVTSDGYARGYQNDGDGSITAGLQEEHKLHVDTWRHVVFTYDGSVSTGNVRKIYIDGVKVKDDVDNNANNNAGPILDTNNHNIEIGRYASSDTKSEDMIVDDIKIYERVLSAAEVSKNYKATKSKHRNS